jgi:multidrug efflux pump subunit AcrA (membrane-fusion protein)
MKRRQPSVVIWRRNGPLSISLCALLGIFVWCTHGVAAPGSSVASLEDRQNADRLMVVDCLLPAQVRQLGTGVTYLAPRRAIKTMGSVCAIRGGEYVAYDRANYSTALKVWLPAAQGGDKVAQTYVGEIYEKGLGIAPDYASAASWYQKAADQGYSRALINLGFLYEQGLGVPKDQATALKLYRKAAGIEGSINLEGRPSASKEELDALRKELERTRQDLERARRMLDEERLKSSGQIERLTQKKLQAAAAGNAEETRRLESLLKEREAELEKRRQQVAQFEQANQDFRARLTGLEGESASLRQQLEQARRQLAQSQREIQDKKNAATEAERRLDAMQQEIARQKSAAAPVDPTRTKALEAELQKNKTAFERQKQEIIRLEADVTRYKSTVAKLEARPQQPTQVVAIAPPSIQIIDPPIVITRDTATVKVRAGLTKRAVVGRVTAPAGLLSFAANDVLQEVDADGYFKTSVELGEGKTRVTMVAVDRQGKRALLEFFLQEDAAIGKAAVVVPPRITGQSLGLGKYYALVIGNQKYQKLAQLDTPEADAADIAALLKDRYGFTVTILLNATRWQILEEMNKMRALVTEKDNLLIYYAGHGQLDRVNSLANWLPVDADPASTANWIASSTLTENLNMMSAKHILVVADSCYSGAMTRSSIGQLQPGLSDEARLVWLKSIADSPSRTVLTSGGVSPVMDGGGAKHSVFAQNFIDILSENQDVLPGKQLSDVLSARVLDVARRMNFQQRPEYAPIRFAGGESGDFIFVPKS